MDGGNGPPTEAEDRALFGRVFTTVHPQDPFDVWAVRQDGVLVWHAELKWTETTGGHELVYALTPSVWGGGLGTELARTIVDYALGNRALPAVYATVHQDNAASIAVLTRIGFTRVREIANADGHLTIVLRTTTRPGA